MYVDGIVPPVGWRTIPLFVIPSVRPNVRDVERYGPFKGRICRYMGHYMVVMHPDSVIDLRSVPGTLSTTGYQLQIPDRSDPIDAPYVSGAPHVRHLVVWSGSRCPSSGTQGASPSFHRGAIDRLDMGCCMFHVNLLDDRLRDAIEFERTVGRKWSPSLSGLFRRTSIRRCGCDTHCGSVPCQHREGPRCRRGPY